MAKSIFPQEDHVNQKNGDLERAALQLKKEFIGIDRVIDHLITTISSWYIFPELQERPVVVNLWGMTGIGKTSLINRLAQLLNFEKKYYHFDLGVNSDNASTIKTHLKSLFSHSNGEPAIIALDEFQHARTLNESGDEISKYYSRVIWDLLDSGKFQSSRQLSGVATLHKLLERVKFFVENGVKVKNGKIISGADFYQNVMGMEDSNDFILNEFFDPDTDDWMLQDDFRRKNKKGKKAIPFLPVNCAEMLFELSEPMFHNVFELKKYLLSLDENGILQLMEETRAYANSRKVIDCSKCLIIVMGNLDEAYTMSGNLNPDINADEFYEMSLKIKLPDIKAALGSRFRHEQIARLGNNHIIYPAFNSSMYQQLIMLELDNIAKKVTEKFGWRLIFTEAMKELIYREGVFPTQGTRPLFSTIQQLVHSRISTIAYQTALHRLDADTVQLHYDKKTVIVRFYKQEQLLHTFKEKPVLNLEKLRKPRHDDMQALTAVHESGHAILSMMLMKIVPECIFSETLNNASAGYVLLKPLSDYLSKTDILHRVAVYLGGLVAEETVFGKDNITTGSEDDLHRATALATAAIKKYGMGSLRASIQVTDSDHNHQIHDTDHTHNKQAQELLEEAHWLAQLCIRQNETLLLRMADYLSEERMMSKETILHLIRQYGDTDQAHFFGDKNHIFYREHLKRKIAAMEEPVDRTKADGRTFFSLNKELNLQGAHPLFEQ